MTNYTSHYCFIVAIPCITLLEIESSFSNLSAIYRIVYSWRHYAVFLVRLRASTKNQLWYLLHRVEVFWLFFTVYKENPIHLMSSSNS